MKILTILGIAAAAVMALAAPVLAMGDGRVIVEASVQEVPFVETVTFLSLFDQVLLGALFCVAIALILWQARPIETRADRRDHAGNDNHLHAADPRPPG